MARVKGDRRASPIRVPVLTVCPTLPNLLEAELHQERGHLAWFQDRQRAHGLRDLYGLKAHELGLEFRIAVLEEHRDDLTKILFEFVEGCPLAVGPRPARNRTDEEARVRIPFDDHVERAHVLAS